jgi:hypothetical protein
MARLLGTLIPIII